MASTFRCTLVTPEAQILDEEVTYASIPAFDGQLGIAPGRAPLVAKLGDGALRLDFARGESRWFFLAAGFAQVKDNKLTLLTEQAIEAGELDRAKAQTLLDESLAQPAAGETAIDARNRRQNKARAMLGLVGKK